VGFEPAYGYPHNGFGVLWLSCWSVPRSSWACCLGRHFRSDHPILWWPVLGRVAQLVCNLVCRLRLHWGEAVLARRRITDTDGTRRGTSCCCWKLGLSAF